MTLLLALAAGLGLGYIIERGDFCFHSTLRGLVRRPPQLDLFRAYLVTLLVATPLVQGFIALGWIEPWIAPWAWQANLVGGLIFGVGMVVAQTCVTGMFYKLGHGMLGTLVALAAWAVGDVFTYRGPLTGLREGLNRAVIDAGGQAATPVSLFGPALGGALVILLGVLALVHLSRAPRRSRNPYWSWLPLGLAVGGFTALAWLLARVGGSSYTYGTSGVPTGLYEILTGRGPGGGLWIPVALVSIVPGSLLAAFMARTLWVRGEPARRYLELAGGGFLMGVGAAISGGCNLGHSLVGVPLLSLGSITTTVAMFGGVFLADRVMAGIKVTASPITRSDP